MITRRTVLWSQGDCVVVTLSIVCGHRECLGVVTKVV